MRTEPQPCLIIVDGVVPIRTTPSPMMRRVLLKAQRCTCTERDEEIVLDTGGRVKVDIFSAQMQSSCCHKAQACRRRGRMSKGGHSGAMGNQGP